MSKYQFLDRRVPIEDGNIALVQDLTKCKNCSLCRKACAVDMGVFDYYDLTTNGDHPICIHCGQCASICPFDSINERSEIDEVKAAMLTLIKSSFSKLRLPCVLVWARNSALRLVHL